MAVVDSEVAPAALHGMSTWNRLWRPKSENQLEIEREKMSAGGREDGRATVLAAAAGRVTPSWPTLTTASPAAVRDVPSLPRRTP